MTLSEFLQAIHQSAFATAIREGAMLFPLAESTHVAALAFVFGTVVLVDLRLLGLASRKQSIAKLTNDLLPWTWGAFVIAAITGLSLFSSTPERYFENGYLRLKFLFMFLAGVNMLVFHFITQKNVKEWDNDPVPPMAARVAGGLSILFWACVVIFGRWVGFTL
jgi:hypothetical protein